ncbi:fused response regulator/phosphatase [Cellvibrio zantedeschiae]|uniref:Fused response regulator/phosphatase n=1 Tax=Cellvibrio zantedeschiae TaxID=1237077 RepID=A0ABQ3APF1_9GAMM|nr:SpoIIE family protein phosphatase [Cellvibrio zantedeschiae]GGY63076.1 fused response regulator/phosphatase [Cellvibrio zantedeschiae]
MPPIVQKASRVLVVDDDEMLNYLFCSFLNSKGLQTVTAHSLGSAKVVLQTESEIDLILLDYQLGDGVGMDLLIPESMVGYMSNPPVIMISANEEPQFLEQCFLGGVDDYIIKPVNLSLLALKVEALIKSVGMQRLIKTQNDELERFKAESEREEQIAKFTYEYLLRQNSYEYEGVDVWLKSFAAFSGDMMLVKKSPSGNLYFILADATGHGLSAAITIMPVVTIFNSMVSKGFHVQKIVTEINRKLVTDTPADRFVAAILIEINPFRREFNIWNGGMPPALWIHKGAILHEFHSAHMAMGILDETQFDASVTTIDLPEEGFIFAYSDGLTEQENAKQEPYSIDRVIEVIKAQPDNLLEALSNNLLQYADTTNYSDDISVCMIRPALVFEDLSDSIVSPKPGGLSSATDDKFEWSVKLSGRQLENCEMPPLCNHFLQQIGVDQQVCQKIFAVIAEMVSNAIDHGVLGLSSGIKENPDGFIQYFYKREERLKTLTNDDFVKLSITWAPEKTGGRFVLEVEDSGSGYSNIQGEDETNTKRSGRGNQLIRKLSESVEIIAPGNKIRATIK